MFQFQTSRWVAVMALGLALSGCGEGYKSTSTGGAALATGQEGASGGGEPTGGSAGPIENAPVQIDVDPVLEPDMKLLDAELLAVDAAIVDVENQIRQIDIPLLGASAQTKTVEQGLDKEIRKIFDKLLEGTTKAFATFDTIEQKVRAEMAKLDATNPLHAIALFKLNEALAKLRDLKARLGEKFRAIVLKIDGLVASVDGKLASMDPKNPLTWVAAIAWQIVRTTVMEYRDKFIAIF
jgi:hypothetical protein